MCHALCLGTRLLSLLPEIVLHTHAACWQRLQTTRAGRHGSGTCVEAVLQVSTDWGGVCKWFCFPVRRCWPTCWRTR